jgi:manganese/zinc/iron transport system permease protein
MIATLLAAPETVILLTGILVAVAAALPGSFLVLRGSALVTDAISHSVVFGIALVWLATGLVSGPLQVLGAAAAGLVTVLAIEGLTATRRLAGDAAMGIVFPTLFAAGVLVINLYARDIHLDTDTVLLGEIGFVWLDTLPAFGQEVPVALLNLGTMALVNAGFVALFWKELKVATFDPDYARLSGLRPDLIQTGLLALTSATAVAAFDAVGAVLFVAFAIIPAATAYLMTDRLSRLVPLAAAIGAVSAGLGQTAAFRLDVSIGGMMAVTAAGLFAAALVAAPGRGILATFARRRSERLHHAQRTLVAHLFAHRDGPRATEESAIGALGSHLHWSRAEAARVVLAGLDDGLIRRDGGLLLLTDLGVALGAEMVAAVAPAPETLRQT